MTDSRTNPQHVEPVENRHEESYARIFDDPEMQQLACALDDDHRLDFLNPLPWIEDRLFESLAHVNQQTDTIVKRYRTQHTLSGQSAKEHA